MDKEFQDLITSLAQQSKEKGITLAVFAMHRAEGKDSCCTVLNGNGMDIKDAMLKSAKEFPKVGEVITLATYQMMAPVFN